MNENLELAPADATSFGCVPRLEAGKLVVAFNGTGDVGAITLLGQYLPRVHAEAVRLSVSEVTCDFRKLSFMNSSCFKAFVTWIDGVKSATTYRIRFLTDPEMRWQRRSLEALRRLASDVVTVES